MEHPGGSEDGDVVGEVAADAVVDCSALSHNVMPWESAAEGSKVIGQISDYPALSGLG